MKPRHRVAAPLLVDDQLIQWSAGCRPLTEFLVRLGGGWEKVYLAQDTRWAARIAIKLLPAYLTQNKDRLRRFEQRHAADPHSLTRTGPSFMK